MELIDLKPFEDTILKLSELYPQTSKAELRKRQIQDYINAHPEIRKEATLFVEEKHSNLEWVYKEKMITAKMASIANNNI